MLEQFKKLLLQLFTENDGSWCPVRLFGIPFAVISSNVYIALGIYTVVHLKQPFDYVSFGKGLGLLWGVTSAMITGKQWVEGKNQD